MICVPCSLSWTAFYCYYADFATDQVSEIGNGDTVYNSNWYEYPIGLQKYMILMIARSQEPVHFTGFNMFYCSLELFSNVKHLIDNTNNFKQCKKLNNKIDFL